MRCLFPFRYLSLLIGAFTVLAFLYASFVPSPSIEPAIGPARREGSVRVIEGWTLRDLQQALFEEKGVDRLRMAEVMGTVADVRSFDPIWREEFAFLRALPTIRSLEGYLFPDTYRVWEDQLPVGLVRKQLEEFAARYGSVEIHQDLAPLRTLDDVVILASIVEKEVRTPEDRQIVAGIFLERLRIGMALQSDATLQYVTQSGRTRSSHDELKIDSRYYSYQYRGLPPGPICNPGATSIEAVLHPVIKGYRYFLTDTQGKVLYARTFEEHRRNRQAAGY